MLSTISPSGLLSGACFEFAARFDVARFDPLCTPAELGIALPVSVTRAVAQRQAEYVAGRFAAIQALRSLGCAQPGGLEARDDRSVVWPEGFVGSITHTSRDASGYVAAAVARKADVFALGRDTEKTLDETTAQEIESLTLDATELELRGKTGIDAREFTGVAFSAKESLFKAAASDVGRYFDFHDAVVTHFSSGSLRLELRTDLAPKWRKGRVIEARFLVESGLIHTAIEILRS